TKLLRWRTQRQRHRRSDTHCPFDIAKPRRREPRHQSSSGTELPGPGFGTFGGRFAISTNQLVPDRYAGLAHGAGWRKWAENRCFLRTPDKQRNNRNGFVAVVGLTVWNAVQYQSRIRP